MSDILGNYNLASPYFLLGLLAVPYIIYRLYKHKSLDNATISLPSTAGLEPSRTWKIRLAPYLPMLWIASYTFMIIALARPQLTLEEQSVKGEGIDIMLAMDVSPSMLARDFDPDRLEASKIVAREFIKSRKSDRIGLVVFAGESFTQCPVTTDHKILDDFLAGIQIGMLEDGTAIGMGLATAVNRLKDSKATSKIVILLTDGVNNKGYIDPMTAAEIAKKYNIKVYTIGIGINGYAPFPQQLSNGMVILTDVKVEIDEALLQKIAEMTNGKYFRAIDKTSLENIYAEVNRLEKSEIETDVIKRYTEKYRPFLLWSLAFFISWWAIKRTLFFNLS